jgi:hypothetical protein
MVAAGDIVGVTSATGLVFCVQPARTTIKKQRKKMKSVFLSIIKNES